MRVSTLSIRVNRAVAGTGDAIVGADVFYVTEAALAGGGGLVATNDG